MSKIAVRPLSKCSREKLAAFDLFAQFWGMTRKLRRWKDDPEPKENYERSKEEVRKRLHYLEHQNHQWCVKHQRLQKEYWDVHKEVEKLEERIWELENGD